MTAAATALGTARTVTMLFTDIEGSTVLLRRLGPQWGEALTAHREIVRAAIAESRGEEMGIAAAAGEAERAARVAGCADARRAALTMRRTPEDEQQLALFLAPARAALGDAGLAATRREGRSLAVAEALDLVTSLPALARTEREALDR